jgi:hypothetical protein
MIGREELRELIAYLEQASRKREGASLNHEWAEYLLAVMDSLGATKRVAEPNRRLAAKREDAEQ